jgi:hypothetical protein
MTCTYAFTFYLQFFKTNHQYDITHVYLFLICSYFSVLFQVHSVIFTSGRVHYTTTSKIVILYIVIFMRYLTALNYMGYTSMIVGNIDNKEFDIF